MKTQMANGSVTWGPPTMGNIWHGPGAKHIYFDGEHYDLSNPVDLADYQRHQVYVLDQLEAAAANGERP